MINNYVEGKAFIPDLLAAYHDCISKFKPEGPVIVLGLVKGAIHALGKTIVKIFLEANNFKVIDLGLCNEPESFAKAAKEYNASAVGISVPVTTSINFLKKSVELVKESCPNCKVFIGGCAINSEWVKLVNADGYADDAKGALSLFKRLVK